MPNDERVFKALAMVTIGMTGDTEARSADLGWEGGCPEALGAMMRLTEGLVKMLADAHGLAPDEMLQQVALAIAAWDT